MRKSAAEHLQAARKSYLENRPKTALREVDKALRQRKNYHLGYLLNGNALFEVDQYDSALECYERAIEICPSHYEAYDYKASTLLMMGGAAAAESVAQKSLALLRKRRRTTKESLALVYDTLARVLLGQNKNDGAVAVLRQGVRQTDSKLLAILLDQILESRSHGATRGGAQAKTTKRSHVKTARRRGQLRN